MSSALQYLTNEEGEKTAVIVPLEDYIKFMEDMEDVAAVAERREEPRVNNEQFLAELRKDGILHDHLA
jgi:PHD/YefM family antitoxin component YafN of YafNO toxin-antitoxin module